jgi:hypothetical protein
VGEIEERLGVADAPVRVFQRRGVQALPAPEVVVDHRARRLRALGHRVDARTVESPGREFLGCGAEDLGPGLFRRLGFAHRGEFLDVRLFTVLSTLLNLRCTTPSASLDKYNKGVNLTSTCCASTSHPQACADNFAPAACCVLRGAATSNQGQTMPGQETTK